MWLCKLFGHRLMHCRECGEQNGFCWRCGTQISVMQIGVKMPGQEVEYVDVHPGIVLEFR
jgi:hypothetical protein